MTDECEYDALTQNTLTATFSPEHVQIDTKDGEEDEEALDESMSPYLASTQSTSDASQCPRCMGSPVGSAQEEKLVAVQTPISRPLCDTFKFEVTPNNVTCTSLLGAAKFHQAIASQTIASSPLRQEAGGTVGVDAEESRHASPLLPTVCPPSGVRSNDCTGKQLVPREDTAAISTPGSCSHITHGPASGTSGKLRGSEHSPPSLGRNRGVETRFRAARHVCLGKHGTDEGGAIGLAGGPGRRGNYLLGPMGHSTSTKVPKPIKDIVAESLKAMLERDDRERLKREGLRFVKGGTISTSAGLQPTPGKDRAPLLRHTDQGSPKKASQILVMRHAGELSGSRGIPDIGEGVGFEGGDGSGGGSATPGADSASPSPVEGVERALEEARKDGPNAPDSLSGRVKNDAPVKKVEPVSSREAESQGASGRRLIRTTAEWEKHTKGFGSRILKSMGFDSATGEPHQIDSVLAFVRKQMARRRASREGIGYDSSSATLMAPCEVDPSRVRSTHSYYRVPVAFPFEAPMTAQDQMMQRVLAAVTTKRHGMFESPTGTGKSQALLCSLLAFQRWATLNTGRAPKIFYCVRTHTQQNQMIKELEKSPYRPTHAALASRTQLCVNPMVVGDGFGSDDDEGESVNDVGGGGARPNAGSTDRQHGRRRSRPNRHSMQQSCEALRSKVNHQRLNKFLKQPDGGKVPYDDSMPDLSMDRAGIAGRLSTDDMVHVGCPHWRMMSSPAYAELLHEYARPKPGLIEGDGVHDLSDDRAFGRDPKGFLERKREARRRGQAGCEAGSNGDCCGRRRYHDAGSNNSSTASTQYPSAGARTSWQASPVSSSSHAAVIDLSYESSGSDVSDGIGGEGSWNGLGRCRAPAAAESGADSPSQASGADPMLSVQTSTREQRFGERPRGKGLRESLENVGGREGSSTAQGGSSSGETRDSREAEGTELIGCPMYANQVLAQQAQLVIVTYNYVLDPNIRSAMLLSLQDAIVVIDKAHNVEGVCRDAGSVELSAVDMANIALDLCLLSQRTKYSPSALVLLGFMLDLLRLAARESGNLRDFEAGTPFDDPLGQLEGEEVTEKTWAYDSAGINFWRDLTGGRSPASHSSLVAKYRRSFSLFRRPRAFAFELFWLLEMTLLWRRMAGVMQLRITSCNIHPGRSVRGREHPSPPGPFSVVSPELLLLQARTRKWALQPGQLLGVGRAEPFHPSLSYEAGA